MDSKDLFNLLKPVDLTGCTTYCGELARTFPKQSENFVREDLHYTGDGMQIIYSCKIDGRKYSVLLKPIGR